MYTCNLPTLMENSLIDVLFAPCGYNADVLHTLQHLRFFTKQKPFSTFSNGEVLRVWALSCTDWVLDRAVENLFSVCSSPSCLTSPRGVNQIIV